MYAILIWFLEVEKAFECYICQAKFTQSGTMKVRVLRKPGENATKHQCPPCGTNISWKNYLGGFRGKYGKWNIDGISDEI